MEVVVKGRHYEVSDRFRAHVEERVAKLEKYDHRVILVDVEVTKEPNPRLADQSMRVQITIMSKGPVIRAEAAAEDPMTALDKAMTKLSAQARKAADRKRIHRGSHAPMSLAQAMGGVSLDGEPSADEDDDLVRQEGSLTVVGDGPPAVREKKHPATPMTLDQALYQMELVGHDFFLFIDETSSEPAVVYRRKGYAYGVIRLGD